MIARDSLLSEGPSNFQQKGEDHTIKKGERSMFQSYMPPAIPVSPVLFSAQTSSLFTISALHFSSFEGSDLFPVMLDSMYLHV